MACAFVSGCNPQGISSYNSIVSDVANDGVAVGSECDFWTGAYFEKSDMESKSFNVNGKTYTGEYDKSIVYKLNSYTTDIYVDNNSFKFGIRSDTSEVVLVNLMNADFFSTEPFLEDVENPQETAIALSKEIAKGYVDNIDEYEQIIEDPVVRENEKDGKTYQLTYYFTTFARKIAGYYTSDYITVKMTSKGNLASIIMGDIGAFSDKQIEIDSDLLNESVTQKVNEVYEKTEYELLNSEIRDQKLTLTPDGDICILSNVRVELYQEGAEQNFESAIEILTSYAS